MEHLLKLPGLLRARLKELLPIAYYTGAVLLLYVVLDRGLRHVTNLPETSYEQPFLFFEFWRHFLNQSPEAPFLIGGSLAVALALLVARRDLFQRGLRRLTDAWQVFTDGKALRLLLMLGALLMIWVGTTYEINLYFNQSHLWDRFLLLVLGVLLYWRPLFVFPFLLQFLIIYGQFVHPIDFNPGKTEFNFFARVWMLFAGWFLFYVLTGRQKSSHLVFLVCCLLASMYWGPGSLKLRLNWITHPYVHWLHLGAYSAGWLAFLEPAAIVSHVEKLAWVTRPLMVFTLFVEWGSLFFLWRRGLFKVLLVSYIFFHIGVFATTGMFFWKWILFEMALFAYFVYLKNRPGTAIFSAQYALLSLVIIGASSIWFQPSTLSWYDTPVSCTYRFEAVGRSGQVYDLPACIFTPYSDMFALSNFNFLSEDPQLTGLWDITGNRALADTLRKIRTPDGVLALESSMGLRRFDAAKKARFEHFLARYFTNWNTRGSRGAWFSRLQPPMHLWTHARSRPYREEEPIAQVNVYQVVSFYDGDSYRDIRKRVMSQIAIPDPPY